MDDSDLLYKHSQTVPQVGWVIFDEGDGSYRVQSGAFQIHDDGISCYQHSVLLANALDWRAVKRADDNGVFQIEVRDVRGIGFGVTPDPNPPYIPPAELHPRDVAHALMVPPEGMGRGEKDRARRSLAKASKIIHPGHPLPA
ncbi:MAG TPA: hypothetical protein VIW24_03245 [Aldersonia sp.]